MARDNKRKAEAIAAPLSEEDAKKRDKAYQKVLQKEKDLKTIVDANTKEFREAVNAQKQMTTAPERKPVLEVDDDMKPVLNVGDYVKVDADTSPNMNRPEGFGFVVQVRGVGAATIVSVKYDCAFDSARTHHAIPFQSTTCAIFGQDFEGSKVKCTKVQPDLYSPPNPLPQQASSVDNSNLSHSERLAMQLNQAALTNRKKGWFHEQLNLSTGKRLNHTEKNELLMHVMLLEEYIARTTTASSGKSKHAIKHKRSGKFVPRKQKHNPLTLKYLVQHAWGCSNSYLSELKQQIKSQVKDDCLDGGFEPLLLIAPPSLDNDDGAAAKTPESVIDNFELASTKYTAEYLFAINSCRSKAKTNLDTVDKSLYTERFNAAKRNYAKLDSGSKAIWEAKHHEHLERQPAIKDQIIAAIRKNPKRSWKGIEADINYWCSDSAIYRWVTSRPGYKLYCERVVPLLTDAQKKKHFKFAQHFRNNWGLGSGKYLLVEYDEKWFWGLVMRRGAKSCEDLGINQQSYSAYHKSHIAKTMGVAFTAFAFEDSIENGGEAVKLGFFCAQSFKVAKKLVRKSVRQPDGSIKQCGPVKRRKGDKYKVDCAVTGSSPGTADDPSFL